MKKCPYCFEELSEETSRCPHCNQFFIDDIPDIPYRSVEKKACLFCGKKILKEARICKHCHKWLDQLDQTISDIDWDDFA